MKRGKNEPVSSEVAEATLGAGPVSSEVAEAATLAGLRAIEKDMASQGIRRFGRSDDD